MITTGKEENTLLAVPLLCKIKKPEVLSFLLGLNHADILGSIYFTISLRFSPRAGRTETR